MGSPNALPTRRVDGWGFDGVHYEPPAAMLAWLEDRFGRVEPFPSLSVDDLADVEPAELPGLGCELEHGTRARYAASRGQGLPDLLRLRSGALPRLADAIARPTDRAELQELLDGAARHGLVLVPRGGGTSVTGGVNVPDVDAPVVVVDLGNLAGLVNLDESSRLATFGAGTTGPALEAALAEHGLILGHYPQSWELSTLGGWIATRSAGQESLGYGRIENLVAGLELMAPGGRLDLPAMPASAAGPDLRQLVLGSEGRFGVITRATVRVRPRPEITRVEALLTPSWQAGIDAARELVQAGLPLSLLRLSDATETRVAMMVGLASGGLVTRLAGPLVKRAWRWRGLGDDAALLLLGASDTHNAVNDVFGEAHRVLRPRGVAWLGARPGRKWLHDRFRHPYLRDALLDRGVATETLETAAPWSRLDQLYGAVSTALRGAGDEPEMPVLCHLSHPYRDGTSLYFTFFFRCPRDPETAIARWASLKRAATRAIADAGGTLSHHHGIGAWHTPWYPRETGDDGARVLRRMAAELDPRAVLNPHVLLDPTDRLES